MMASLHAVPDDFPREAPLGVVPGTQPKLLVRETNGRYHRCLTDEELRTRYEVCEDLAQQLAAYTSRKMLQFSWSFADALAKVERSVSSKVGTGEWSFAPAEVAWVTKRTAELLSAATNFNGNEQ